MASRFLLLGLIGIALALSAPVGGAGAATTLGSAEADGPPTDYLCGGCPAGARVGFRQFALRGAVVEAPEAGVLVSTRVFAKRLTGTAEPRIAVLRPTAGDGVGATIVASAPVRVSGSGGALHEVENLHLAVEPGDTLGFLFRAGEVGLGTVGRPKPDGTVVSFSEPCEVCGADGGTGRQLLFEGIVEPDDDADGLGDESQDPDLGGLPGFGDDDPLAGDELFDDEDEEFGLDDGGSARRPRRLRVLRVREGARGATVLLLAVPRAGTLRAVAAVRSGRRLVVATGEATAFRPGRVRLRLRSTRAGRRLLVRRSGARVQLVVEFRPARGARRLLRRATRLEAPRSPGARPRGRS